MAFATLRTEIPRNSTHDITAVVLARAKAGGFYLGNVCDRERLMGAGHVALVVAQCNYNANQIAL